MKRFALLVLCLVAVATPALAINGVGDISAYADANGTDCNILSPGGSAIMHVYVVHKFKNGEQSTYCRFKGQWPAGLVWLSSFNTGTNLAIGSFNTDISVAYGACITSTTLVGDALFQSAAVSPTCSYFELLAADGQLTPLATDCAFVEVQIGVGKGIVNPDQNCQCNVATEPTSWGRVKALYR
jgi:hypothetical protein